METKSNPIPLTPYQQKNNLNSIPNESPIHAVTIRKVNFQRGVYARKIINNIIMPLLYKHCQNNAGRFHPFSKKEADKLWFNNVFSGVFHLDSNVIHTIPAKKQIPNKSSCSVSFFFSFIHSILICILFSICPNAEKKNLSM